jgi:hypothetical protein
MNPIKSKLSGTGLATFFFFKDRKASNLVFSDRRNSYFTKIIDIVNSVRFPT